MFTLKLENDKHNVVNINDERKYVVLDASGLNPPSASLFLSKSPNRKGVKYNGSTLDARNITLTIKILGDVEANRNALYEWIDTEQYVKIHFSNGVKNVYCEGHIEDCDIPLFTNDETITLAIVCENPYWNDLNEISHELSILIKQFEFPFSIDKEGIPFSTIKETNTITVFNSGAETGLKIIIKCLKDTNNIVIQDAKNTNRRFEIKTELKKDWIIEIDTDKSPKTVKAYKPDGSVENLLKYVGYNPTWFTLKKGNNWFNYENGTEASDIEITIRFTNKYLGV